MGKTKSLLLHLSLAASCTFSWQAKCILGQVEMQLEIQWMGKPGVRFTFCISIHQSWPNMCVFNPSWDTLNEMFLKLSMNTDPIYAWNPAFTTSPSVLSKNVLVGSAEPGSCDSYLWWNNADCVLQSPKQQTSNLGSDTQNFLRQWLPENSNTKQHLLGVNNSLLSPEDPCWALMFTHQWLPSGLWQSVLGGCIWGQLLS